jgi:phage baseplate assembly protein W
MSWQSSELVEREQQIARRRVLGWGALAAEIFPGEDLGRDLVLARNAAGRLDLATVEGMDNLAQALTLALTTRLGDDIFNVEFGFDGLNALVEETVPILVRERVRIGVIRTIKRDPRVGRIVDVKLDDEGQLEPLPAGSRTLNVRVVFETLTGETLAVDLARGASNVRSAQ